MTDPRLLQLSRQAVLAAGFQPDFSAAVQAEVAHQPATLPSPPGVEDLRALLWSSIDNDDSKDLDQIEVCQPQAGGVLRVLVGVADVDARVGKGTATDQHAALNTCSVYAEVAIFPMLPLPLSTGLTSVNAGEDRLALIAELDISPSGEVTRSRVYRAWVKNHAQLAYNAMSAWLEGQGPLPPAAAAVPGLDAQLRLQDEAAQRLKTLRHQHGALDLESEDDVSQAPGRAKELIEDFMVAANGAVASYLQSQGRSGIARVVRTPRRWPRVVELAATLGAKLPAQADPRALATFLTQQKAKAPAKFAELSLAVVKLLGRGEYVLQSPKQPPQEHFGLAVHGYTHATAPNRRFVDLVTHRLVKAALAGTPAPYSDAELAQVSTHCSDMEHRADKVERTLRKARAALTLQQHLGQTYAGVVTGASDKGIFVRIQNPTVEGRVTHNEKGLDVGDAVQVKLLSVDPVRGFIDFQRVV